MRPIVSASVLLTILALFHAATAAQVAKTAKVDPAKVRAQLLAAPFIEGQLTEIDEADKRFGFQHVHRVKKLNPAVQKKLAILAAQFNFALGKRSTSLEELKKMQADGMALEKTLYNVTEEIPLAFQFKGEKNFVVRTLIGPVDADGKPRKLSAAEERKLKGDPRLPGYQATIKDLDTKRFVRVVLDRTKPKPPPGTKPEEAVYSIGTIVIIPDPVPPTAFKIPGE